MSWIIMITDDETEPRYVERLNGFAPPTLTGNAGAAKLFATREEAHSRAEKIRAAARKEGAETVTVEVIEYGAAARITPETITPKKLEHLSAPPTGWYASDFTKGLRLLMRRRGGGWIFALWDGKTVQDLGSDPQIALTKFFKLKRDECVGALAVKGE